VVNIKEKLFVYLHDPPDKALKIENHEERSKKILSSGNIQYSRTDKVKQADALSSKTQRFIIRTKENKEPVIDFLGRSSGKYFHVGYPVFIHPISTEIKRYETLEKYIDLGRSNRGERFVNEFLERVSKLEGDVLKEVFEDASNKFKGEESKQWAYIWQFYPVKLKEGVKEFAKSELKLKEEEAEKFAEEFVNLPADTRFPDHAIWTHLDLTSALSVKDPTLLRIKIVPVQPFIANSRKQLDLWASSHLLSMLMYKALEVIVDKFGPEHVIYPSLRDQPFFLKFYLGENIGDEILVANLPNKALAIVSGKEAEKIEEEIKKRIRDFLLQLYREAVDWAVENGVVKVDRSEKDSMLKEAYLKIVREYFTVSITWVSLSEKEDIYQVTENAGLSDEDVKKWLKFAEKKENSRVLERIAIYPLLVKILDSLGERKVTEERFEKSEQLKGWKCHVCGENLAIFGDMYDHDNLKSLWLDEEPLCPMCLIKRYYPVWIRSKTGQKIRFESVVDVALLYKNWRKIFDEKYGKDLVSKAREVSEDFVKDNMLVDSDLYYSSTWESGLSKKLKNKKEIDEEKVKEVVDFLNAAYKEIGNPPKYYAILVMDGDDMGKVISGEVLGEISTRIHPNIRDYVEIPEAKYYSTPQVHVAISQALANFSIREVRSVVKDEGLLIYAGGDDVLAILPVDKALEVAYKIRKEFGKSFENGSLLPGWKLSAGILIVHYKHPLYDALEKARDLLNNKAKNVPGKDTLAIGLLKRSGSYYISLVGWELIRVFYNSELRKKLLEEKGGVGKRFIYHVLREVDTWPKVGIDEMLKFEVIRHIRGRNKEETKELREKIYGEIKDLLEHVRGNNEVEKVRGLFTFLKIITDAEVFP